MQLIQLSHDGKGSEWLNHYHITSDWSRLETGDKMIHEETGKPVLEFVCIQRKDTGVWAIPGGKCSDWLKIVDFTDVF